MKKQQKKKMVNKITIICSILFALLIIGQYVVRFIDGNEKKRPWDSSAKEYVMERCSKLYADDADSSTVRKICSCYTEKIISNQHSYYEYKYYISKELRKEYLKGCENKINNSIQLGVE